jgi:hypothetical protein
MLKYLFIYFPLNLPKLKLKINDLENRNDELEALNIRLDSQNQNTNNQLSASLSKVDIVYIIISHFS